MAAGCEFDLIVVCDDDPDLYMALKPDPRFGFVTILKNDQRMGYWKSLVVGTRYAKGDRLVNLANDVIPGRDWLRRAVVAFNAKYGQTGEAVLGFNDGIHPGTHAGHFMASRSLLMRYYGEKCWPDIYDHQFGDTEITLRALAEKKFSIAPWAVLFHNHAINGAEYDAVYALSHTKESADRELFNHRRANNWN